VKNLVPTERNRKKSQQISAFHFQKSSSAARNIRLSDNISLQWFFFFLLSVFVFFSKGQKKLKFKEDE
jgi:hypothetical protein